MAKDKLNKKKKVDPTIKTPKTSEAAEGKSTIWKDERFQHLVSDPRFKGIPKEQRKVKIDKRFQGMFTDKQFKVKYTVDKYGRRVNQSNADDLKKYYELESGASSDDSDDADGEERRKEEQAIIQEAAAVTTKPAVAEAASSDEASTKGDNDDDDDDDEDDDNEVTDPASLRKELCDPEIDYARGHGRVVTDSSDDELSEEEEEDELLQIDHVWGELDAKADMTEQSTRRLAVCNMDWDRIRAVDLMVLFSSFLPPGGSVLSVKIYPSEFGKERLAEEEQRGPQELVGLGKPHKKQKDGDSSDEDDLVQEQDSDAEEGDEYHMEKLRQYQLNRLRYYYAVVECDSVDTADKIYQECDGNEYESSATRVDLRFIPDDTSFADDEPSDVCTDLPDASAYKPRQFTTTALQQAKVDLTWDETAVERRELSEKLAAGNLDAVSDRELRQIVAYSSEEEEDEQDEEENDEQAEEAAADNHDNENGQKEPAIAATNATPEPLSTKPKKKKKQKDDMINKYKALLAEINADEEKQKKGKFEMEFTWDVAAEEQAEKNDSEQKKTAAEAEQKRKQAQSLTPIEKVMQKRNEKNKQRKEERKKKRLQSQRGSDDDSDANSDSDESIPDGVDLNDPYFAEEFADGDFAKPKAASSSAKQAKQRKSKAKTDAKDADAERQERELELLLDDDDDDEEMGKQHFSLDKIMKTEQETKSKRKRRHKLWKSKSSVAEQRKPVEDNFQVNLNDDRFKAVYTSHLFNIDPSDAHFKRTKGMEQLIDEKLKRRHGTGSDSVGVVERRGAPSADDSPAAAKRPKKQLENALLVKSLKRKIEMKGQ